MAAPGGQTEKKNRDYHQRLWPERSSSISVKSLQPRPLCAAAELNAGIVSTPMLSYTLLVTSKAKKRFNHLNSNLSSGLSITGTEEDTKFFWLKYRARSQATSAGKIKIEVEKKLEWSCLILKFQLLIRMFLCKFIILVFPVFSEFCSVFSQL